jgi:hypothetical protein
LVVSQPTLETTTMLTVTHMAPSGVAALVTASAQLIYDTIPLGAAIAFSDGTPRPPERFKNKLREWKNRNGAGTLVSKSDRYGGPEFKLHEGDFGSQGTVLMRVTRAYSVNSPLTFTVTRVPQPGEVLVVTRSQFTGEELRYLGRDLLAAADYHRAHRYSDAVFLEVQADGAYLEHQPDAVVA